MTEAEWLVATRPTPMLLFVEGRRSSRKSRLFAVACCDPILDLITPAGKGAILAGEQFADGEIDRRQLNQAWSAVGYPKIQARQFAAAAARGASCSPGYDATLHAAAMAINAQVAGADPNRADQARQAAETEQATLIRDIFGNPFRPVAFDPRWRTADVTALARGIYEDRAFERLPLLADALMDAGCDHEEVLAHCRSEGPHVRGCWVVDLVLGKE